MSLDLGSSILCILAELRKNRTVGSIVGLECEASSSFQNLGDRSWSQKIPTKVLNKDGSEEL